MGKSAMGENEEPWITVRKGFEKKSISGSGRKKCLQYIH
jgi:hypothetical protein